MLWSEGTGASLPEDLCEEVPGKVEVSLVRVARPALCVPRQGAAAQREQGGQEAEVVAE